MTNPSTVESWDTVSGFCFFVRNTRGRTFPMLSTFGLTVSDAKKRAREMIARRTEYNRSRMDIVELAHITLKTNKKLAVFDPNGFRWQEVTDEHVGNLVLQSHPSAG